MKMQGFEMPGLTAVTKDELSGIEGGGFFDDLGDLVKDVVNVPRDIVRIGGDLLSDAGQALQYIGGGGGGSGVRHQVQ